MLVNTVRFGEIEVFEERVILFANGMPGFEHLRRFTMITPDTDLPFTFLQSIDDGDIAFILTNPFLFYTNYEFELSIEAIEQLNVSAPQDVSVWSIVSVADDLASSTINLLAPVVIHEKAKTGKQIILHGSGYLTKNPLIHAGQQLVMSETAYGEEQPYASSDS